MLKQLRAALVMFLMLTIVTGVAYPALVLLIGQGLFPYQANGSVVQHAGRAIGSDLIGQAFDAPKYFWGRPSATAPVYNGAASTGSNLGPTNPAQLDLVKSRVAALRLAHPEHARLPVPVELVTASASGLDPHISPAAAEYQVSRIARVRGMTSAAVRQRIAEHTQERTWGLLGEPRVNVLALNRALDR